MGNENKYISMGFDLNQSNPSLVSVSHDVITFQTGIEWKCIFRPKTPSPDRPLVKASKMKKGHISMRWDVNPPNTSLSRGYLVVTVV